MVFRKKYPSCGTRNDKERVTCVDCGTLITSETDDERTTEVSQKDKPNLASTMKQSAIWKRRTWFWVGVTLLSISALWWLIIAVIMAEEPEDVAATIGVGLLLSAVPIGIGIYCVVRSRKAQDAQTARAHETTSGPVVEKAAKRPPDIKEQDSKRILIGHTTGERIGAIFGLAFVIIVIIIIAAQFLHVILASVVGILIGLLILRAVLSGKIVINKSTKTITINKRSFFLTSRQRVIPFSEVRNVVIDYLKITSSSGGPYGGGTTSRDAWKVSLDIGGKVEIKHTTKKANMLHLASELSKFIGVELVDNSAKPESSSTGLFRKVKGFFRK